MGTKLAENLTVTPVKLGKKTIDGDLFLSCLMTYEKIEKLRAVKLMF